MVADLQVCTAAVENLSDSRGGLTDMDSEKSSLIESRSAPNTNRVLCAHAHPSCFVRRWRHGGWYLGPRPVEGKDKNGDWGLWQKLRRSPERLRIGGRAGAGGFPT